MSAFALTSGRLRWKSPFTWAIPISIFFNLESFQRAKSFKIRGALNKLLTLVSFMARKEKYIAEAGSCSTVAAVMEQRERIGGHGALPQNCVDPVVATCQIITAWQTIVSREVPPADTAVLSVGGINVERATYNIIPEKVSVVAGIRICSEDFAWYQIRIPGSLMFLGVGNEAKGTNYAQHHAKFNTDDDALALGVTGLVAIAWDFLLNKK